MKKATIALAGIGVGAGLMCLADPDSGRRRRARLGNIATHTSRMLRTATEASAHDVENRLCGLVARMRGRVSQAEVPIDAVLVERVRARLGRLVPHARRIEVHART
jgi:hypothetical protein